MMLLDQVDIDMVGGMLKKFKLKKSGPKRWKMLCPFHEERTPSFVLDNESGQFRCFGCAKTGNWDDLVDIKERFL